MNIGHNNSLAVAQRVNLPASVIGSVCQTARADYYRFEAQNGQEIGVQVTRSPDVAALKRRPTPAARLPVELLLNRACSCLIRAGVCLLKATPASWLTCARRRGTISSVFAIDNIEAGTSSIITCMSGKSQSSPLGPQARHEEQIEVQGVNLGPMKSVRIRAPADAKPGSRVPLSAMTPHGLAVGCSDLLVGEFPEERNPTHGSEVSAGEAFLRFPSLATGESLGRVPPRTGESKQGRENDWRSR
jgi:hypothetical protein